MYNKNRNSLLLKLVQIHIKNTIAKKTYINTIMTYYIQCLSNILYKKNISQLKILLKIILLFIIV